LVIVLHSFGRGPVMLLPYSHLPWMRHAARASEPGT